MSHLWYQPVKVDRNKIPPRGDEVRVFVTLRNEVARLPHFLKHYRDLGVDRFLMIDNGSADGTRELLADQPDCHVLHAEGSYFADNVAPPKWQNAVLNTHGAGGWCIVADVDELLVYPGYPRTDIKTVCAYLDQVNATAMVAPLVDMYGDGPVAGARYDPGQSFLAACPYFDPSLGTLEQNAYGVPDMLMHGGVRERAFLVGPFRRMQPPCLTKVPLVRWEFGMQYLVSTHTLLSARIGDVQGALLHFKFLVGFQDTTVRSLHENPRVVEKGLQERSAYVYALSRNPSLTLRTNDSVRLVDMAQLVDLGWMVCPGRYASFLSAIDNAAGPGAALRNALAVPAVLDAAF